jgi:hypothetical protein
LGISGVTPRPPQFTAGGGHDQGARLQSGFAQVPRRHRRFEGIPSWRQYEVRPPKRASCNRRAIANPQGVSWRLSVLQTKSGAAFRDLFRAEWPRVRFKSPTGTCPQPPVRRHGDVYASAPTGLPTPHRGSCPESCPGCIVSGNVSEMPRVSKHLVLTIRPSGPTGLPLS